MGISKLIDFFSRTKKTEDDGIKTSRFAYRGKSIFKGEIENKKDKYMRKTDQVIFRAKYIGEIKYGYFAADITPPSPVPSDTFHLDRASGNVTSFCKTTIKEDIDDDWNIHSIPLEMGNLNGRNIKTDWFYWSWDIPEYVPKGSYKVVIGLWRDLEKDNDKITPIMFSKGSFYITNFNDSHYQPSVRLSS